MHPLVMFWDETRRLLGWDSGNSFGYLFHSGSGATLELGIWGTILWFWRSSCTASRKCLRHARHAVKDTETGTSQKVCWKHAGLEDKYGVERIRAIQAKNKLLYFGDKPGRG